MKITIIGAGGRMGKMLLTEVLQHPAEYTLAGAVDRSDCDCMGRDAGLLVGLNAANVNVTADAAAAIAKSDAVIEFSSPQATLAHNRICAERGVAHIIGTTGLDSKDEDVLHDGAKKIPIVYAPNMSLGINLLIALVEQAAARLKEDYDIEIFEAHHRHKIDAPSGTALALGRAAAKGRGVKLEDVGVYQRHGFTGDRKAGSIGFSVFRGGDVVGDHTVTFAGSGERIEISHLASNRVIYARGAVQAARWAKSQKPGLYSMRDMLKI